MSLAGVTVNKIEGSAVSTSVSERYPVVIGTGDGAYTPGNTYIISNTSQLYGSTVAGYGPGVDLCAKILKDVKARNGGQGSVVYVPVTASIDAPTKTYTSSSVGVPTRFEIVGTPNDDYQVKVQVLEGTTVGVGLTVRYSLDDGLNWASPQRVVGAGYVTSSLTNTGCSFIMSGTWAVGDTVSSWIVPKTLNANDIAGAIDTIIEKRNYIGGTPGGLFIAGTPLDAVSGSALFSAVNSGLTTMEGASMRTTAILQVGPRPASTSAVTKAAEAAAVVSAMSSVATSTGNVITATAAGGSQIVQSRIPGCGSPWRPHSYSASGRFAAVDISTNPGWVSLGALSDYVVQKTTTIASPSYDEFVDGPVYTSDTNKLEAPRSYINRNGVYLSGDASKCAANSTYDSWHRGRVINLACDLVQFAQDTFVNDVVDVNVDGTGTLTAREIALLSASVEDILTAGLVTVKNKDKGASGYVSGYKYDIDASADVLTTKTLYSTLDIVPKGDLKNVVTTVGFSRVGSITTVIR